MKTFVFPNFQSYLNFSKRNLAWWRRYNPALKGVKWSRPNLFSAGGIVRPGWISGRERAFRLTCHSPKGNPPRYSKWDLYAIAVCVLEKFFSSNLISKYYSVGCNSTLYGHWPVYLILTRNSNIRRGKHYLFLLEKFSLMLMLRS